jgi:hypothetical protein
MKSNLLGLFYFEYKKAQSYRSENLITTRTPTWTSKSNVAQSDSMPKIPGQLSLRANKLFKAASLGLFVFSLKKQMVFYGQFLKSYITKTSEGAQRFLSTLTSQSFDEGSVLSKFSEKIKGLSLLTDKMTQDFDKIVETAIQFVEGFNALDVLMKKQSSLGIKIALDVQDAQKNLSGVKNIGKLSDSDLNQAPLSKSFYVPSLYMGIVNKINEVFEAIESFSNDDKFKEGCSNIRKMCNDFAKSHSDTPAQAESLLGEVFESFSEQKEDESKKSNENSKKTEAFLTSTTNKIAKYSMSDQFAKNYYKDALKGLESNDSLMKEFYRGMADFYDAEHKPSDSRKNKDLYGLFSEEEDLVQKAHPGKMYVGKALGEGGLVENGHQSKDKINDIVRRKPSGNFRNK